MGRVALADVLRGTTKCVESPHKPGYRQFYIVAPFLTFIFAVRSCRLRRGIILAAIGALIYVDSNVRLITAEDLLAGVA